MKKRRTMILLAMTVAMLWSCISSSAAYGYIDEESVIILPKCEVGQVIRIPVGEATHIQTQSGRLIPICDLLHFNNQSDADMFRLKVEEMLSSTTRHNPTININSRATHGDVLVASKKVGEEIMLPLSTLSLRVAYTTSGNSNTGTITYHQAYTTLTGITTFHDWDESYCNSEITENGKNIYARTAGTITWSLVSEEVLELGSQFVDLDGYAYVVR